MAKAPDRMPDLPPSLADRLFPLACYALMAGCALMLLGLATGIVVPR